MRTAVLPACALALVLLLAGCASSASAPAGDASGPASDPASPHGSAAPSAAAEALVGVLRGDAQLEGGCVWLDTARGRIEVIWPDGYAATADPVRLTDPSGDVVARAGDEVRIEGSHAPDLVSTCQVGEIWTATALSAG